MKLFCFFITLCTSVLAQDIIKGQYFIHVDENLVQSQAQEDAFVDLLKVHFNTHTKKFYNFNPKKVLFVHADSNDVERVQELTEVRLIEQNAWAYADQSCSLPTNFPGVWGLDRIDQRPALLYTDPSDPTAGYMWDNNDGTGVRAHIFDTGIDLEHSNFEGRAEWGYVAEDISNETPGDFNGHGTHTAGTVAARDYGVAKNATVVAIKILDDNGSGPWSAIIEGMDWLRLNPLRGSHVCGSMSVGGAGQNTAVQTAMEALIASGVPVSVSAGNNGGDACGQTPAFIPACITVGATDIDDDVASFSNEGPCVDLFAPGVDVLSTYPGDSTDVLSGTSMSAPHVTGAIARYMSSFATAPSPADVATYLKSSATPDVLNGVPGDTANLMLFCDCQETA